MEQTFIQEDFLLENEFSKRLYHDFAADHPLIDYHCHLPPDEIVLNKKYKNITELWIAGDHYKWRAMRTNGIKESQITGDATDEEKFMAWAKTVPNTLRNPLYHWTHLELKRYFDTDLLLNENTATEIYHHTKAQLQQSDFTCRGLINKMKVEVVCTTDDPTDTLLHHKKMRSEQAHFRMSSSFRPDKALLIESDQFLNYLERLSASANLPITSLKSLCEALILRMDYFHENGCRISDHGLSSIPFSLAKESRVGEILQKKLKGMLLTPTECEQFKTYLLLFLSEAYHQRGWVQQFHLGALRNTNSRMEQLLGPDTGWDSIGEFQQAQTLSQFLNQLDQKNILTKTILYNLNPAQNEVFASMVGNFNDGTVRGKIQYGSGWWFLDQKEGIIKQLNALSNMGLISCFIGMLTDSRSFLSFPRHEYFRRILCNEFGKDIQNGELPTDINLVGGIIEKICYYNAKEYFDF
ncbi:MAG: glucuronate isomerase [Flavobacteriaceae bacterium]